MANPRIVVDVIMDALKLKRGAHESEEAVSRLDKALAKLGKGKGGTFDALSGSLKGLLQNHLGPLGDVAEASGKSLDDLSKKTLVAGAAVVGLAAVVGDGVRKLGELAGQVREFHEQSGASFETSSRMVGVFKDLGVEVDNASELMGELARGIDEGKLEEYGIQAVYAKNGTVDLVGTLGNVADKMNATVDPTERSAMGAALFGEEWVRLAPILNEGSAGIKKMAGEIDKSRILTADAIAEQKEMERAMRDLGTAVDSLQIGMAQRLVPTLGRTVKGVAELLDLADSGASKKDMFGSIFATTSLERARELEAIDAAGSEFVATLGLMAKGMAGAGVESARLSDKSKLLADAELEAADAVQILESRQKDAAEAAKELTKQARDQTAALKANVDTVLTVNGAVLGYEQAQLAAKAAVEGLAEKQKAATEAVNEFGADAPEATEAQRDYASATLDSLAAMDGAAQAAVTQAEKLALAAGQTFTAEQRSIVYREALEALKSTSNDPGFVGGMDGMIWRAGAAADAYERAARQAWALEAAASAAALAAAGVGRTGGGDMAATTADNAERILSNQRSTAPGLPGVQVVMDGYRVGELVTQRQRSADRATR